MKIMQSIKIKFRNDGTIKAEVTNPEGKEIATIVSKNGHFNMIERRLDNRGKSCEVTHSAWGNEFYHEDKKLESHRNIIRIDKKYCEKKLQEKKNLRKLIKYVVKNNKKEITGKEYLHQ